MILSQKEHWAEYLRARISVNNNDCWEWKQRLNHNGYGAFNNRKLPKFHLAHRAAYEIFVGPIPHGLVIDHLCRNRRCINPAHLEAVTPVENCRRGNGMGRLNANKTHCINGHAFTPENTYRYREKWRNCRECLRNSARRYKAATRKKCT